MIIHNKEKRGKRGTRFRDTPVIKMETLPRNRRRRKDQSETVRTRPDETKKRPVALVESHLEVKLSKR